MIRGNGVVDKNQQVNYGTILINIFFVSIREKFSLSFV
jgi:hypothetical protein